MKIIRQLFCKHKKTIPIYDFAENVSPGRYKVRTVWKCRDCGKEMIGGK